MMNSTIIEVAAQPLRIFGQGSNLSGWSLFVGFFVVASYMIIGSEGLNFLEDYTHGTSYHLMIQRIYREIMMMGLSSFVWTIIGASGAKIPIPTYLGLQYADYNAFVMSIYFCVQGIFIMIGSMRQARAWERASKISSEELQIDVERAQMGWRWKWVHFPFSVTRDQVEFRILQSIFSSAYNISTKHTELNFSLFLQLTHESNLLNIIDFSNAKWVLVLFITGVVSLKLSFYESSCENPACAAQEEIWIFTLGGTVNMLFALIVSYWGRQSEIKLLHVSGVASTDDYPVFLMVEAKMHELLERNVVQSKAVKTAIAEFMNETESTKIQADHQRNKKRKQSVMIITNKLAQTKRIITGNGARVDPYSTNSSDRLSSYHPDESHAGSRVGSRAGSRMGSFAKNEDLEAGPMQDSYPDSSSKRRAYVKKRSTLGDGFTVEPTAQVSAVGSLIQDEFDDEDPATTRPNIDNSKEDEKSFGNRVKRFSVDEITDDSHLALESMGTMAKARAEEKDTDSTTATIQNKRSEEAFQLTVTVPKNEVIEEKLPRQTTAKTTTKNEVSGGTNSRTGTGQCNEVLTENGPRRNMSIAARAGDAVSAAAHFVAGLTRGLSGGEVPTNDGTKSRTGTGQCNEVLTENGPRRNMSIAARAGDAVSAAAHFVTGATRAASTRGGMGRHESVRAAGRRKMEADFKLDMKSNFGHSNFADVFIFGRPWVFYAMIDVVITCNSLYLAWWTTNFVLVAMRAENIEIEALLALVSLVPAMLTFPIISYAIKSSSILKALSSLNLDVVASVVEKTESNLAAVESFRGKLRASLLASCDEGDNEDKALKDGMMDLFEEFAADQFSLTAEEFVMLLNDHRIHYTNQKCRAIFRALDINLDGLISIEVRCAATMHCIARIAIAVVDYGIVDRQTCMC
jgi:hypothetical protein